MISTKIQNFGSGIWPLIFLLFLCQAFQYNVLLCLKLSLRFLRNYLFWVYFIFFCSFCTMSTAYLICLSPVYYSTNLVMVFFVFFLGGEVLFSVFQGVWIQTFVSLPMSTVLFVQGRFSKALGTPQPVNYF